MRKSTFRQLIERDLVRYMAAHRNRTNRILHWWAFLLALAAWAMAPVHLGVTVILAVLHYLLSAIGHICCEGNRPGAVRHPWLGFYAGFLWFFLQSYEWLTRRDVLSRIMEKHRVPETAWTADGLAAQEGGS